MPISASARLDNARNTYPAAIGTVVAWRLVVRSVAKPTGLDRMRDSPQAAGLAVARGHGA
jgi:hypothetical protein